MLTLSNADDSALVCRGTSGSGEGGGLTTGDVEDIVVGKLGNYLTKTSAAGLYLPIIDPAAATFTLNNSLLNGVYNPANTTEANKKIVTGNLIYSKAEIDTKISQVSPDMSDIYTKDEVNDLIPDVSGIYTKDQVDDLLPDMSDYYTKDEVDALIPQASAPSQTVMETGVQFYSESDIGCFCHSYGTVFNNTNNDPSTAACDVTRSTEWTSAIAPKLIGIITGPHSVVTHGPVFVKYDGNLDDYYIGDILLPTATGATNLASFASPISEINLLLQSGSPIVRITSLDPLVTHMVACFIK
jgi:hypothetical protein